MTLLWVCILWALASAAVAMIPMRHQYVPGVALLVAAPVLIVFIGTEHGPVLAILAIAAFLSMFRNPLRYLWARVGGRHPEIPK